MHWGSCPKMVDYVPLNDSIDYATRANSTYHPLNPQSGIFLVGDKGIEFQSEKTRGYIQIPWQSVSAVLVQFIFGDHYVRGFTIQTTEDNNTTSFEFIVKDAKETLKAMRQYLPRETFRRQRENLRGLFKKHS
ncbi:MAG: DUF956 family protein [Aerococcus sp.]|nr:DUF956 family protein [Aerococcus sp.]